MLFYLFNWGAFWVGWVVCLYGGRTGQRLLPVVVTIALILAQLIWLRIIDKKTYSADIFLLGYIAPIAFLFEAIYINIGVVDYTTKNSIWPNLPPAWLWCLYFLFGITYNHSFVKLLRIQYIPFFLGFFGGPFSYWLGARSEAVSYSGNPALLILGLFWGVFMLITVWINRRLTQLADLAYNKTNLDKELTVYFDEACPVCKRESKLLQKRKLSGSIVFATIGTREEFAAKDTGISYERAMEEMFAKDDTGAHYHGVDALCQLYTRTSLPMLAMLLQAPLLHPIFRLVYRIWAKNRPSKTQ